MNLQRKGGNEGVISVLDDLKGRQAQAQEVVVWVNYSTKELIEEQGNAMGSS